MQENGLGVHWLAQEQQRRAAGWLGAAAAPGENGARVSRGYGISGESCSEAMRGKVRDAIQGLGDTKERREEG